MRKFKHKITGDIWKEQEDLGLFYYSNTMTLPKKYVENSHDWEEIFNKPYMLRHKTTGLYIRPENFEYVIHHPHHLCYKSKEKDFDKIYEEEGIVNIPEYVECVVNCSGQYTKGKIYKNNLDQSSITHYCHYVCDNGNSNGWDSSKFKPSTKEAYDAQFIKKEYEILSFKGEFGNTASKLSTGFFQYPTQKKYWSEEELLKAKICINSIKRLSDNSVFTIEDSVDGWKGVSGKIEKFIIENNTVQVWGKFVHGMDGWMDFKQIKHSKICLFTTHDGIDIFEGDKYWFCYTDDESNTIATLIANKSCGKCTGVSYFSTKQAAKEYVAKSKVLFVTEDGVELKIGDVFYGTSVKSSLNIIHKLILDRFSNQENARKGGALWFSSEAKAQEYIDMNKPVFSWKQIEDAILKECRYDVLYPIFIKPALLKQL